MTSYHNININVTPFNKISVDTVFKSCVERAAVRTNNLVGITTDGKSANSGKNTGLWRLLQRYLGKDILTVWCVCVCHRSDLALEAVQSEVPELSVWMSNVLAVSTFFRTSPRRTKLLHKVFNTECITTESVIRIDNRPYIKFF